MDLSFAGTGRFLDFGADAMSTITNETKTWPELAIGLYDTLTGRGAEITYDFENFEIMVPSHAGPDATHAKWKMNGILKIRTRDQK